MRDTDELVAFLCARLDDDEQMANSATAGPWATSEWSPEDDELSVVLPWRNQQEEWGTTSPEAVAAFRRVDSWPDETDIVGLRGTDARHIARHDPARVLAGVQAKRAILDEHTGVHDCGDPVAWRNPARGCRTVRLLASEYRGEPGWRKEWAT